MSVFVIILFTFLRKIFNSELVQNTSTCITTGHENEIYINHLIALTRYIKSRNDCVAEKLPRLQRSYSAFMDIHRSLNSRKELEKHKKKLNLLFNQLKTVNFLDVTLTDEFKKWQLALNQKFPEFEYNKKYMEENERLEKLRIQIYEKQSEINQYFENEKERLKSKKHDE